jgi:TRAP-type C4-dicarboxylate transport system permease small subunit
MSGTRLAALVLIIAGILGLAYGGFTYTKDTHQADIGPIELSVEEKETVNIPVWLGAGALIAGVLLLVIRGKKGP